MTTRTEVISRPKRTIRALKRPRAAINRIQGQVIACIRQIGSGRRGSKRNWAREVRDGTQS